MVDTIVFVKESELFRFLGRAASLGTRVLETRIAFIDSAIGWKITSRLTVFDSGCTSGAGG